MTQRELIELLESHKSYITTVREWDDYAKKHNLPSSMLLIREFGSWNKFKLELNVPIQKQKSYSRTNLEEVAIKHKEYFSRKAIWDEFSQKNGLPSSVTYINTFGSWNKVKEFLGIHNEKKKNDLYSKEDIVGLLKEHAEHYESRSKWDKYAKEHKLPTYKTIRKHFDEYDEILEIVDKVPNENKFSREDLLEIAYEHRSIFMNATYRYWNQYAATNHLPSAFRYYVEFGSWKNAKMVIEEFLINKTNRT